MEKEILGKGYFVSNGEVKGKLYGFEIRELEGDAQQIEAASCPKQAFEEFNAVMNAQTTAEMPVEIAEEMPMPAEMAVEAAWNNNEERRHHNRRRHEERRRHHPHPAPPSPRPPMPSPGRPEPPQHLPPSGSAPHLPPPGYTPRHTQNLKAVDPGSIRGCLYSNTYIWLNNGQQFWFYPTFISRRSIAGYRWTHMGWVYMGFDLRLVDSFFCGGR